MNTVIRALLLSDLLIITAFGLVEPIFAIFMTQSIARTTIAAIGIASGCFMVTKALVQVPFSRRIDVCDDVHDTRWLLYGSLIVTIVPVLYLLATEVWHIYLISTVQGLGAGLAYPAWLGLWSTHLDKGKESFEWSFYSTVISIGGAVAATAGGLIANAFGFEFLFVLIFCISAVGTVMVALLSRSIKREAGDENG